MVEDPVGDPIEKLPIPGEPPDWLHEKQLEWWNATELTTIGLAGTQGGKTAMLPYLLLKDVIEAAPFVKKLGYGRAIYASPTLTLLQAQALPALELLWCEQLKLGTLLRGSKPRLVLSKEGSEELFGVNVPFTVHCAYTSDPNNVESITACAAAWDEAGQKLNKELAYEAIMRRLKAARSAGYGRLRIGTTPYEHGWLLHRLVSKAKGRQPVGKWSTDGDDPSIRVINWPSWSNPLLDEQECRRELKDMPEWRWEMMYLGRFTKPAGVVYDCFDEDNLVDKFPIPPEWPIFIGLDFGLLNTAAVVIAEETNKDKLGRYTRVPTGRYYLIETFHANEGTERATTGEHISRVHAKIRSVAPDWTGEASALGGSHNEKDSRDLWSGLGQPVAEPSISEVDAQIACVYAALKTGRLKIFRGLRPVINELENFSYKVDPETAKPMEEFDGEQKYHHLAALRYVGTRLFKRVEMVKPDARIEY